MQFTQRAESSSSSKDIDRRTIRMKRRDTNKEGKLPTPSTDKAVGIEDRVVTESFLLFQMPPSFLFPFSFDLLQVQQQEQLFVFVIILLRAEGAQKE